MQKEIMSRSDLPGTNNGSGRAAWHRARGDLTVAFFGWMKIQFFPLEMLVLGYTDLENKI